MTNKIAGESIVGQWSKLRRAANFYIKEKPKYMGAKKTYSSVKEFSEKIKPLRDIIIKKFNLLSGEFVVVLWAVWGIRKGIKKTMDAVDYGMKQHTKFESERRSKCKK